RILLVQDAGDVKQIASFGDGEFLKKDLATPDLPENSPRRFRSVKSVLTCLQGRPWLNGANQQEGPSRSDDTPAFEKTSNIARRHTPLHFHERLGPKAAIRL